MLQLTQSLQVRSALLCSDIHLSDDTPEITARFLNWLLAQTQQPVQAVLILGDLFDAWIGDDVLDSHDCPRCAQQTVAALSEISARGIQVGLMHGNRDFLLGPAFAKACGGFLLADPCVLTLQGQDKTHDKKILLTHGDALCTQDLAYQAFRTQVRSPDWQSSFLSRPLAERLETARQLRMASETEKSGKSMEIMDIDPSQAAQWAQSYSADILIHGHTHRPGRYQLPLSGGTPNELPRWVLSDWSATRGDGIRLPN